MLGLGYMFGVWVGWVALCGFSGGYFSLSLEFGVCALQLWGDYEYLWAWGSVEG